MKIIEKRANGTKRVSTLNDLPTLTQQQYKDQVDVNNIMKRYKKTGSLSHVRNAQQGAYLDLTEIPDYAESLMQVKKAQESFEMIPAELRIKFNNDPKQLINYLKDPKNKDEAIKHGLLVKRANEETQTNEPAKP